MASGSWAFRPATSISNASNSDPETHMPKRAILAIVTTALGLALLFSFKTPGETASALGPGHGPVAPVASTDPGASSPAPVVATPAPVAGGTSRPASTPQPSR